MEEKVLLTSAKKEDFCKFYEILESSFPMTERRDFNGQKALFDNLKYKPYVIKSGKEIIAVLSVWDFTDMIFVEHFAVLEKFRGGGLGKRILLEFLETSNKKVCLEVELPVTELAIRRIHFYERLGFIFNNFQYFQPSMQLGQPAIELKIMSYPKEISSEEFFSEMSENLQTIYKGN